MTPFIETFSANAAKLELVPYFQQIIDQLKGYLVPTEEEGPFKVQVQALGMYTCTACAW